MLNLAPGTIAIDDDGQRWVLIATNHRLGPAGQTAEFTFPLLPANEPSGPLDVGGACRLVLLPLREPGNEGDPVADNGTSRG